MYGESNEEKIAPEIEKHGRTAADQIEQKLFRMFLDKLLEKPDERIFGKPGHLSGNRL